eukprot:5435825-Prymnesium_polylepis.1
MPLNDISCTSVLRASLPIAANAPRTFSCSAGICACTTSRMSAIASAPFGAGPSASGHHSVRKCWYNAVGGVSARLCTMGKERTKDASTATGKLLTNFSHPLSGVGTAPARSVSQCTK